MSRVFLRAFTPSAPPQGLLGLLLICTLHLSSRLQILVWSACKVMGAYLLPVSYSCRPTHSAAVDLTLVLRCLQAPPVSQAACSSRGGALPILKWSVKLFMAASTACAGSGSLHQAAHWSSQPLYNVKDVHQAHGSKLHKPGDTLHIMKHPPGLKALIVALSFKEHALWV